MEVEATMSLFVYVPKMERGLRVRGDSMKPIVNAEVDNSNEAKLRREKKEAKEKARRDRAKIISEMLRNAKRDAPVIAPRRVRSGNVSRDIKLEAFDVGLSGKLLIKDANLFLNWGRQVVAHFCSIVTLIDPHTSC